MSTPVATTPLRPQGYLSPDHQPLQRSFQDLAYQGDLDGGSNLVYIGFARPGSSTSATVWQIFKIGYSGSTPISITWPEGSNGAASNDFLFAWTDRANYTYA